MSAENCNNFLLPALYFLNVRHRCAYVYWFLSYEPVRVSLRGLRTGKTRNT